MLKFFTCVFTDEDIVKVHYNSEFEFSHRLYGMLDVDIPLIQLCQPMSGLIRHSLIYIKDAIPGKCFRWVHCMCAFLSPWPQAAAEQLLWWSLLMVWGHSLMMMMMIWWCVVYMNPNYSSFVFVYLLSALICVLYECTYVYYMT